MPTDAATAPALAATAPDQADYVLTPESIAASRASLTQAVQELLKAECGDLVFAPVLSQLTMCRLMLDALRKAQASPTLSAQIDRTLCNLDATCACLVRSAQMSQAHNDARQALADAVAAESAAPAS